MIVRDQIGFRVDIPKWPQRIISLVPSQTELLFDLGLEEQVIGITKFCVHPSEKIKNKIIIGGTKKFYFEVIDALQPDLILGNKEENYEAGIMQLKETYPVWMSDIYDLTEALEMIRQIGIITNTLKAAHKIIQIINTSFKAFKPDLLIPTAYFIWREPFMSIGQDTFIHQMLKICGFRNVFTTSYRYPTISREELQAAAPQLILLSSEPYPFKLKHLQEFQALCPNALIKLVDGELFSWYGSRLQFSVAYFKKLTEEVRAKFNFKN